MGVMQRVIKPKTPRAKRALEERAPKNIENTKQCLFFQGKKTGQYMRQCLRDIYVLKRHDSQIISKSEQFLPFEDILPIERLAHQHDASLFAYASHSKKRPNNLVIGRMFDHHILDMVELGVINFEGLNDFKNSKISENTKPCMVFCGSEFQDLQEYRRLKSLLIDFFKGTEATDVSLQGFEHALLFTSADNKIFIRSYKILLKKSGTRIPRVELEEIGPSMDIIMRRTKLASSDLIKKACQQPKAHMVKTKKNHSKDVFGTKLGRIHMTKQNLDQLQTRKIKALKKTRLSKKNSDSQDAGPSEPMEAESQE